MINNEDKGERIKPSSEASEDTLKRIKNLSEKNIEEVEKNLSKSDLCSLLFILRDQDDDGLVLQDLEFHLFTDEVSTSSRFWPFKSNGLLIKWVHSADNPNWRTKIVEALLVTQNFGALKLLKFDVDNVKSLFEPTSKWHSVHINHLRKLLYLLADDLHERDWKELCSSVNFEHKVPWTAVRREALEFPETSMLYWSSKQIVKINSSDEVNVNAILKHLTRINRDDWARILSGVCQDRAPSTTKEMISAPSTVFQQQREKHTIDNKHDRYDIKKEDAGICLIFNQENVEGYDEPREGTKRDAEYLQATFKCFGFEVHTRHDLSAGDMIKRIHFFSAVKRKMPIGCFVVAILSHGERGVVKDINGKNVGIEELQDILLQLPKLSDIPKILLIQACQSNPSYSNQNATDGGKRGHISVYMSALPGDVAYRHKILGSYFVNHLCDTLLENAHGTEWTEIVRMCNAKMDQEKFANLMAWHKCAFTKRLVLVAKNEATAKELLQEEQRKRALYFQQHK